MIQQAAYFYGVQHVEFFHRDHFDHNYHRVPATGDLAPYIDYFWETNFSYLWAQYPRGFSDALFPNTGYTYLINMGTPFVMQVGDRKFAMKTDGFLPRHHAIECFHRRDNHLFGIKFNVAPLLLEKKINFSEYREYIFPLSYLIEPGVVEQVKAAGNFSQRVAILETFFRNIITRNPGLNREVLVVTSILGVCQRDNLFDKPVEAFAADHGISSRTLQRYFEKATGVNCKTALQILRIRKAAAQLAAHPEAFSLEQYGYYDHSHFYKHLRSFLSKETVEHLRPHLRLLATLHKK